MFKQFSTFFSLSLYRSKECGIFINFTVSINGFTIVSTLSVCLLKTSSFQLKQFVFFPSSNFRNRIRKHLAIFSLSAPLLTILTYFGIGQEQKETLNSVNATGIAMLFSAGTFLYVATVHVLPELTTNGHGHVPPTYSHLEAPLMTTPKGFTGLKNSELAILIVGALTPLLLTMGHHH